MKNIGKLLDQKLDKRLSETEKNLKNEIKSSEQRVMAEVGKFLEDHILEPLEQKADKSDIDRIERKLDRIIDKDVEQDSRLKRIESIPVVAHEIKHKK